MKLKDIYIEIGLFILCVVNLFIPVIPQILLYPLVIGAAIYKLPKEALAFCCLLFLKDVNHAMFFLNFHVSGVAPLTVLWGLFLMKDFLKNQLSPMLKCGKHLWIVIAFMLLSMIVMGNYDVNFEKFTSFVTNGIIAYLAYSIILYKRDSIDFYRLALFCAIFAVFLLQLNAVANNYGTPASLIDFGFYRQQVGTDMYVDLADTGVLYATHYQFFGTMCAHGFALCLALKKLDIIQIVILFLFDMIAIGYTGARQYLFIMVVVYAIYIIKMKGNLFIKVLIIASGSIIVSYIMYESLLSDYFGVISEMGLLAGTGREELFDVGINMFYRNPIMGVGFGGYNFWGEYGAYPHNMIVELLAEVGILGVLFILVIEINNKSGMSLMHNSLYGVKMFYVLLVFFLRSMISLSLTGNVVIFSVLSACCYFRYVLDRKYIVK